MKPLISLFSLSLLAAQTVNLLPFASSNFSISNWTRQYVQIGSAMLAAPDGSQSQSLDDVADPSAQVHSIRTAPVQLKSTDSASISIFLHSGALHQVVLSHQFYEAGVYGAVSARFDLDEMTTPLVVTECCAPTASFSTSIADVGNGWRRIGVSVVIPHGHKIDASTILLQLEQPSGGPYLDAIGQAGLINLWGAQVDKGASPLPYQAVP